MEQKKNEPTITYSNVHERVRKYTKMHERIRIYTNLNYKNARTYTKVHERIRTYTNVFERWLCKIKKKLQEMYLKKEWNLWNKKTHLDKRLATYMNVYERIRTYTNVYESTQTCTKVTTKYEKTWRGMF